MTTGFHTYGVDWQKDKITWYFDGAKVYETATPAGMDKPMYMLANLAVGGDWPGSPDGTTTFPATLQIDYIRAYSADAATSSTRQRAARQSISGRTRRSSRCPPVRRPRRMSLGRMIGTSSPAPALMTRSSAKRAGTR